MNTNEILENAEFCRIESFVSAYSVFYDTLSVVSNRLLFANQNQFPKFNQNHVGLGGIGNVTRLCTRPEKLYVNGSPHLYQSKREKPSTKLKLLKGDILTQPKRGRGDHIYPVWT